MLSLFAHSLTNQIERVVNVFVNSELWAYEFAALQSYASHAVMYIYSCSLFKPNKIRQGF